MAKTKSASAQPENVATDALQNLLQVEEGLQAQLAAAKAQAIAATAQAEADAAARRASVETASRAAIAALEAEEEARVTAECKRMASDAASTVELIEGLTEARVQELAAYVIRRLLGESPEPLTQLGATVP